MSSLTTIDSDDVVADSRQVINDNFTALNEDKLQNSNNLSDVSNAASARSNLGVTTLLADKADKDGTDPVSITIADAADAVGLKVTQNDTTNEKNTLELFDNTDFGTTLYMERTNTDTDGPYVISLHDSASPAANDLVLWQAMRGKTDNGTTVNWGQMFVTATDVSNGSKDSTISFHTYVANSAAARLVIGNAINGIHVGNASANGIVSSNGNQDLVLQTGNATTGNITITDGADGAINIAPNGTGEAQVGGEKILTEADIGTAADEVAAGNHNHDATYAPIAKGVTNGDTHDHSGGYGAQINHTTLSNIGANTHAQIDTHIGSQQVIYKSADETVNNSDVLQNDDHLLFAMGANEVWAFKLMLFWFSGTTPDFAFQFVLPSGGTMRWYYTNLSNSVNDQTIWDVQPGGGFDKAVEIHGTVFNDSTPGNMQLQWAQATTNASDTKVYKGSHIIAHRLA